MKYVSAITFCKCLHYHPIIDIDYTICYSYDHKARLLTRQGYNSHTSVHSRATRPTVTNQQGACQNEDCNSSNQQHKNQPQRRYCPAQHPRPLAEHPDARAHPRPRPTYGAPLHLARHHGSGAPRHPAHSTSGRNNTNAARKKNHRQHHRKPRQRQKYAQARRRPVPGDSPPRRGNSSRRVQRRIRPRRRPRTSRRNLRSGRNRRLRPLMGRLGRASHRWLFNGS